MKDKIEEMILFRQMQWREHLLMKNFSKEEGLGFLETGKHGSIMGKGGNGLIWEYARMGCSIPNYRAGISQFLLLSGDPGLRSSSTMPIVMIK